MVTNSSKRVITAAAVTGVGLSGFSTASYFIRCCNGTTYLASYPATLGKALRTKSSLTVCSMC
jgi:hypothetical protein